MTPAEHRAAAEQALADSGGHHNPSIPLMRGIIHALLALADDEPLLPPDPPPTTGRWTPPPGLALEGDDQ